MSVSLGRSERAAAPTQPPKPRGTGWSSLFFTVIALVGSFHALLMLGVEGGRLIYTNREVARLEADVGTLQAEVKTLQAVVEHRNDPVFREQLARSRGFIYPDETRILTRAP